MRFKKSKIRLPRFVPREINELIQRSPSKLQSKPSAMQHSSMERVSLINPLS